MTGRTEECKFTVTNVNGFFGLNRDERQAVVRVDVNDLSIHGFFPPSAAYQEFQRVVTTDDGHGNVDPAERCNDVGRFHQSDAVDSQNQEKNGEKFVGAQPLVIPHDRNKRHDKENQAKQRRPFGRFDGKSAHPGPERIKTGQFAAHNFGDWFKRDERKNGTHQFFRKEVEKREYRRPDAKRTMPFIEFIKRRCSDFFQPCRSGSNDNSHRHQTPGQHAVEEKDFVSQTSAVHGRRIKSQIKKPRCDRQRTETKDDFSHCVLLQRLRRKPCGNYEKSSLKSDQNQNAVKEPCETLRPCKVFQTVLNKP